MISKEEKLRLRGLISETIILLCKNGLLSGCRSEFSIDGVIGITMDTDELLLVAINQVVRNDGDTQAVDITNKTERSTDNKRPSESNLQQSDKRPRRLLNSPNAAHTMMVLSDKKISARSNKRSSESTPVAENYDSIYSKTKKLSSSVILKTPDSHARSSTPDFALATKNASPVPLSINLSSLYSPKRSKLETPLDYTNEGFRIKQEAKPESASDVSPFAAYSTKDSFHRHDKAKVPYSAKSPVVVQPDHAYGPYHIYSAALRHQQSVHGESTNSRHPLSPASNVSASDKYRVWEKPVDYSSAQEQASVDNLHTAALYGHLGQSILRNEGCFVTSRIMTRKTGRKAKMVREVMLALTLARDHPEHIGTAREIGKNMLVFYKCPPDLINPTALFKYGMDLNTYSALFYSPLKSPPSQTILPIVLRDSPYVCAHYEELLSGVGAQIGQSTNDSKLSVSNERNNTLQAMYEDESLNTDPMPLFNHNTSISLSEKRTNTYAVDLGLQAKATESSHINSSSFVNSESCLSTSDGYEQIAVCDQDSRPSENHEFNVEKDEVFDSDAENIDILNDSSGQQQQEADFRRTSDLSFHNFPNNVQAKEEKIELTSLQDNINAPLLGLQRMVSSQGAM